MASRISLAFIAALLAAAFSLADPCCLDLTCADLSAPACLAQGGESGYCFDGLACGAATCSIGSLGRIADLRAVKGSGGGAGDVVFSWSAAPAADRYDVRYAISKTRIPACDGCAGSSPVVGSAPTFVPAAVHRQAVAGPAGVAFFYNVRPGCGTDRVGACCTPSGCVDVTGESECRLAGGTYAGFLTRCAELSCPVQLGSCCLVDGCINWTSNADCDLRAGTWDPTGTCASCFVRPPDGACCLPSGCMDSMAPPDCEAAGGTFLGNSTTCASNGCALGSCCLPDASCAGNTTPESCAAVSGTHTPATGCGFAPCAGEPGACCDQGLCTDGLIGGACGGTWEGPGSACASVTCPSACCVGGICRQLLRSDCAAAGGSYQGDGLGCSGPVCAAGACCLATSCADGLTPAACSTMGGAYAGAGTTCTGGACVAGACCTDAGCDERIAASCASVFGTFRGTGTTCASVSSCRGACCTVFGCDDGVSSETCNRGYQGDGTTCAADSCPGACCLVQGCAVLPIETCIAGGGSAPAPIAAPTCDQSPCTFSSQGRCCGLFGCYLAPSQDECERRAGTFDSSIPGCFQECAIGTGACCQGTGCVQTTASLCQIQGGEFRGYGTICDKNGTCVGPTACPCQTIPCATGACCGIPTGCAVLDEQECCIRGGVFAAGSACAPTCDPAPCCLAGQCVLLAPGVCAANGGAANSCAIGGGC